ncbi:MlaC/ttg2D family ABC transporter substrate-binding protein [Shimia biformata]|uniref:MlaC/ttg2D family ABC transporter substrate-binding protein n=1 Tax=Shimia biformata TaxID=1294299 RepID=UPI00194F7059|nr:ABC transporter substrate-binding protein [Shimia biformata]
MLNDFLTRRSFVKLGFAASAVAMTAPAALALTTGEATALVDRVVADINKVISSGKPLGGMINDFEKILIRYGDVPIIARSALGADARSLSGSQMSSYTKAFQGYLARKYGKRFNEFVGGTIEVQDARQVKSFYEVRTLVKLKGEAPFAVNFLVSDKSGKNLFFDIIIEGVSIRLSEKTEIGAMLDRRGGNVDQMIADLKQAG